MRMENTVFYGNRSTSGAIHEHRTMSCGSSEYVLRCLLIINESNIKKRIIRWETVPADEISLVFVVKKPFQ